MIKRLFSCLTIFTCLVSFSIAKTYTLKNSVLTITFNNLTAQLLVTDSRCNKTWEQILFKNGQQIKNVFQDKNKLTISLDGKNSLEMGIMLGSFNEVDFSVRGKPDQAFEQIEFPSAFKTPDKENYILSTDGDGILLAADDANYPVGEGITFFCGGGLSMPWMGLTDKKFETGYMAILETPFDAAITTLRENGLLTFKPEWLPSMQKLGYNRHVKYIFFDKGGYVAQCKAYRKYIWQKNGIISLRDHEKRIPAIGKLIGSAHIYVWDDARTFDFAKQLKASGIQKAFILWNPNHLPYPQPGYDDSLKTLGYVTGVYDLYTDIHSRDTAYYPQGATFLSRTYYPGLYTKLVSRKADGSTYSNHFGTYINPKTVVPEIVKRVDKEMKLYAHESYFFDVWQANGLYESYSKNNPLTRGDYAAAIISNMKMMEDKYKVFAGGEWGADFASAYSVFNHGMMTLQRTWFNSVVGKKGTIYYWGDWKNPNRPTQVLGTRVAPDSYLNYSINEYTRVPLYDLVYHDATVSSWRWEDGNHHMPEIWWKKDLFNILYGTAPMWCLDKETWENYRNTFVESYNKICPWLQQIGYDELTDHRFLTDDHTVQESFFSSGKKAIVNFGNTPYTYGKNIIKPKDYLLLNE